MECVGNRSIAALWPDRIERQQRSRMSDQVIDSGCRCVLPWALCLGPFGAKPWLDLLDSEEVIVAPLSYSAPKT